MTFVRREEQVLGGVMGFGNSNVSSTCADSDEEEEEHSSSRVKKWRSLSLLQIGSRADKEALVDPPRDSKKRFWEVFDTETRSLPQNLRKVARSDSAEEQIGIEKIVNQRQRLLSKVEKVAKFDSAKEMKKEKMVNQRQSQLKEKMVNQRQSQLKEKMVTQRQSELTPKKFLAKKKKKAKEEGHRLGLHQQKDDSALFKGKLYRLNLQKQMYSVKQGIAVEEDDKPALSTKVLNCEEMGAWHEIDNFGKQKKRRRKVRSTSSLYACTQEVRTEAIKDELEDDCLEDDVEDDCWEDKAEDDYLETNSEEATLGYQRKKHKTVVRHPKPMGNCQGSCWLDLELVKSEGYESQKGCHTSYPGAVEAEEASNCTMQVSDTIAESEADDFQLIEEDASKSALHLKGIEDYPRGELNEAYMYGRQQEDLGTLKMTIISHSATRHAWNLTACDMQLSELASFPDHSSNTLTESATCGSKPVTGTVWEVADNVVQSSMEGSHDGHALFEAWEIQGTRCSLQETTHLPCDFIETFEEHPILLSREDNSELDVSTLTISQEENILPSSTSQQMNAVLDELSLEMPMSRYDLSQQGHLVSSSTFCKATVPTEILSNKIAATMEVSEQVGLSLHSSRVREVGQLATSQNLLLHEDSFQLAKDIAVACLPDSAVLQASSQVMSSLHQNDGRDCKALTDAAVLSTATFEGVVQEHGGVDAEVQNKLAASSCHESPAKSSPHDIYNSSRKEIIMSGERLTKCDQAHEVIYLSDDEDEEISMGAQGSLWGMGIQSTQDCQDVAVVLPNVPGEVLVHDHGHTDVDVQNKLSSKSQEEDIPTLSLGDGPRSSLFVNTLHTTIIAMDKSAEEVIHNEDGPTVGVPGSPGQLGDLSKLNELVVAAELPGQQLTHGSTSPASCNAKVSCDEVSRKQEPSSIISQHAVVSETDENIAAQKSVLDEETQNTFLVERMPSSNIGDMSTKEDVSMMPVNLQIVPESGHEHNENDTDKQKTLQQCQETWAGGSKLPSVASFWSLDSDSKKEKEVSRTEQVNSGLHNNLSGSIEGIASQEGDTESTITEPEVSCPVTLNEDVSSDGAAKHIACHDPKEVDTPLETGSFQELTSNTVDIASPLQTMETSASALVDMYKHSEENCALLSTIEESDSTAYCENMSADSFCALDSLKPSVPCKFARCSAHRAGVENVETGKTFEPEMSGCSSKTNNGDPAVKTSKMFSAEEEDMLTNELPSIQHSELEEEAGGDTDCLFAGPSRMPHKRKAISPQSQFQLIRASLEEERMPTIRVKRMKQHQGGDAHERKQSNKVVFRWMGTQADRDDYPNGNFFCESSEEIQGRSDRKVQHEPQSGSPIPTAKSLGTPGQAAHNSSPGSEPVLEELHNAANSSCSAFGSPDHNKQPALPRKLGLQQALLQCNDVSPIPCLQQTDNEAPRSGSPDTTKTSPAPGRPKGILKTCQGRCKCPRCLQLYKHTDTASVFIDSQMKFIGRIAKRLIGQLGNMCTIFEEVLTNHQTDSSSVASPLSLKVKGGLDGALEAAGSAKKDLAKMSRDSRRVCHILGRRRITFADAAGKELCDFRVFTPTKDL